MPEAEKIVALNVVEPLPPVVRTASPEKRKAANRRARRALAGILLTTALVSAGAGATEWIVDGSLELPGTSDTSQTRENPRQAIITSTTIPTETTTIPISPPKNDTSPKPPYTENPAAATESYTPSSGDNIWAHVRQQIHGATHTEPKNSAVNVITQLTADVNIHDGKIKIPDLIYPGQTIDEFTSTAVDEIVHIEITPADQLTTKEEKDAKEAMDHINHRTPMSSQQAVAVNQTELGEIEKVVIKSPQPVNTTPPTYSEVAPSNDELQYLSAIKVILPRQRTDQALTVEERKRFTDLFHRQPNGQELAGYGNVLSVVNNNRDLTHLPARTLYNDINNESLTLTTALIDADAGYASSQGLFMALSTELLDVRDELKGLKPEKKEDFDALYVDYEKMTIEVPKDTFTASDQAIGEDPVKGATEFLTNIDVIDKLNNVTTHNITINKEQQAMKDLDNDEKTKSTAIKIIGSAAAFIALGAIAVSAGYQNLKDRFRARKEKRKLKKGIKA